MERSNEKVVCETPTSGKQGTRIAKWKYDAIRQAIRKVVPRNRKGILFAELTDLVAAQLSDADRHDLGSVSWYTVCVKLDMEVKGELQRVPGVMPQRLRRVK